MGLKEDVEEMKNNVLDVKSQETSLAMELIKGQKEQFNKVNKRQFIVILVILFLWFLTIGYLVYLLNDIGTSEETIDIQEVENIDNSKIHLGDE